MHPEMAAILVHSLNRFSLCTKMAAVAVAKLLTSSIVGVWSDLLGGV